jgi:hypothetical protein
MTDPVTPRDPSSVVMDEEEWEHFIAAMSSPAGPTPAMLEAAKLWNRLNNKKRAATPHEPTPDTAIDVARRVRSILGTTFFLTDKESAEEIDRYAERRVAAAQKVIEALRHPNDDLDEDISELFDEHFLPAWNECAKKHGTYNARPAWAAWGHKFLNAVADKLAAYDAERGYPD